jgi:hypothetical protein
MDISYKDKASKYLVLDDLVNKVAQLNVIAYDSIENAKHPIKMDTNIYYGAPSLRTYNRACISLTNYSPNITHFITHLEYKIQQLKDELGEI